MAYPGNPAPRLNDGAGSTLPLLAYLAIATVLMVADLRGGTPEEAAGSVYLFCIPESDYVSGQTLICSGGLTGM